MSSHVDDFNTCNKVLTAKLLRQGYRYHKIRKAFSKFYRRHFDIVSKYNVGLKTLLLQGFSEPEFYGDLVYKFRNIIGKNNFPIYSWMFATLGNFGIIPYVQLSNTEVFLVLHLHKCLAVYVQKSSPAII